MKTSIADTPRLNDLQCLLLQAQDIVIKPDEQDPSSTAALSDHVGRLRDHLEQLDGVVIEMSKNRGSSEKENATISYRRWIRANNRVSLF